LSVRSGSSCILADKLPSLIRTTILSRIISSRRSLYPQCSNNKQIWHVNQNQLESNSL
jgi:hypothetical protein